MPKSFDKLLELESRCVPAAMRLAPTSDGAAPISILDDRLAVRFREASDAAGLSIDRWLDATTAIVEGTETPKNAVYAVPVLLRGQEAVALDEVIVALHEGVSADEFFNDARFASYRPLWGTPDEYVATLATARGLGVLDAVNDLASDPRVSFSEPNFYQNWQKQFDPNDFEYASGNMWHLKNVGQGGGLADADVDADLAWNLNPGGSANRLISIVDDGLETTHPDLNPWVNPGEIAGDGLDNDGNGYIDDVNGWNFVSSNNVMITAASDRHGTAVAGVAAAKGNNTIGVAGVSYNAKVMTARIFEGAFTASDADIASAVYYAAGRNKAGTASFASVDVMNNSWGGAGYGAAITGAFRYATGSGRGGLGTVTLAATGNGYAGGLLYPASLSTSNPGLIAVGGTNNKGTRSDFSNFGTGLDLVAPTGDLRGGYLNIDTTDRVGAPGYNGTDYTGIGPGSFSGTSAASPLAAGIAGLVLSQAEAKGVVLTATQVKGLLKNTTDFIGGGYYEINNGLALEYGRGRVNAFTAVDGVGKPELSVVSTTKEFTIGDALAMGTAFVNGSTNTTIRIRNGGTSDLTLANLTASGSGFSIDAGFGSSTLKIGEATTFTVRFAPTSAGTANGTITFTSNDADESSFMLALSGTGAIANVSGTAFEDRNGSGTREANDTPLASRTVYLDANGNSTLDRASFTQVANVAIPDNNANGITSTMAVSGVAVPIRGLTVTVNLTHQFLGDVTLYLASPAGTIVALAGYAGGDGTSFTNTVFDDVGTLAITQGASPFTGRYRLPFDPLSRYDGESANGTWTLYARDTGPGDVGTLVNWSVEVDAELATATDSQGLFALGNVATGNYTLRSTLPSGWTSTAGAGGFPVNISGPSVSFSNFEFGSAKNNRAYLRVRDDQNANGIFENGEPFVSGRTVFLDANGNGTADVASLPVIVNKTASVSIPDNSVSGASSTVSVSGLVGTLSDVNVTVNLAHTRVGDVKLNLVSPSGTVVTLVNRRGSFGLDFIGTTFDDSALVPATNLLFDQSPFTASYSPETPLSALNGEAPNGTWTLQAFDLAVTNTGKIGNWSLSLTTGTTDLASVSNALGNTTLDLPAGSNSVRLAPLAGWKFTNPASGLMTLNAAGSPLYETTFGVAEAVPPTATLAAGQRSMVGSVRIDFSEKVFFSGMPAAAFTLTGPGGSVPFTASVDNSGSTTKVTLDFASLPDGKYSATVNAGQVSDLAQNPLTPPGLLGFHRLFGDFNGDATVDATDFAAFGSAFGYTGASPYRADADFNSDGTVDALDFAEFGNRFGVTL